MATSLQAFHILRLNPGDFRHRLVAHGDSMRKILFLGQFVAKFDDLPQNRRRLRLEARASGDLSHLLLGTESPHVSAS